MGQVLSYVLGLTGLRGTRPRPHSSEVSRKHYEADFHGVPRLDRGCYGHLIGGGVAGLVEPGKEATRWQRSRARGGVSQGNTQGRDVLDRRHSAPQGAQVEKSLGAPGTGIPNQDGWRA